MLRASGDCVSGPRRHVRLRFRRSTLVHYSTSLQRYDSQRREVLCVSENGWVTVTPRGSDKPSSGAENSHTPRMLLRRSRGQLLSLKDPTKTRTPVHPQIRVFNLTVVPPTQSESLRRSIEHSIEFTTWQEILHIAQTITAQRRIEAQRDHLWEVAGVSGPRGITSPSGFVVSISVSEPNL